MKAVLSIVSLALGGLMASGCGRESQCADVTAPSGHATDITAHATSCTTARALAEGYGLGIGPELTVTTQDGSAWRCRQVGRSTGRGTCVSDGKRVRFVSHPQ